MPTRKSVSNKNEQLFVYEEDEQGYYHHHILMAQQRGTRKVNIKPLTGLFAIIRPKQAEQRNIEIKKWFSVETLERLSWSTPAAGRFSTSADELVSIAEAQKLKLRIIEREERSTAVPEKWKHLPLVKGATGNY